MKWKSFKSQYPSIEALIPSNFMSNAEKENDLRRAIIRDSTDYLDQLENLIKKTPAQKIAQGSYQNDLTRKDSIRGFETELRAYRVFDSVCNPIPADVHGAEGVPDLKCYSFGRRGVDIEATHLASWDKRFNVQEELEEKFDGTPYTPVVTYLDPFFVMPYGYKEIRANEIFTSDIIDQIQGINASNPPSKIENYGIEIEISRTGASGGMIGTTSVRFFPNDPEGAIDYRLRKKAKKQRGYRPLFIFIESRLSFLDTIDMRRILFGRSVSSPGGVQPADAIRKSKSLWESYMNSNGILKIPEGEVGIFSEDAFSKVAGVVFLDVTGQCHVFPNCYSNDIEVRDMYSNMRGVIDGKDFSKFV